MKNLIIILGLFILCGCSGKESPTYSILSIDSKTKAIGSFKEGDIITDKEVILNLSSEESFLINDVKREKVFRISGPITGPFSSIQKSKFEVFNQKYFSLIKENLRKPEKEIKQAVLGGVFRASPININYRDGEVLDDTEISIDVINKNPKDCIIKIFNDDVLMHTCAEVYKCIYNLEHYREDNTSVNFNVKIVCGLQKSQTMITLSSRKETETFRREEEDMNKSDLPELAWINFYLSQKRFIKVKSILETTDSKSEFIDKLKRAFA